MPDTIIMKQLDEFTRAYLECAIWSSTDDDGEPLDGLYSADDIAEETLWAMVADCRDFQESFGDYISSDPSRAGHDFWLTRNRHGAGFWDGDWGQPYGNPEGDMVPRYSTVGGYLTAMSKSYGSFDLYIGDDGYIHGQ